MPGLGAGPFFTTVPIFGSLSIGIRMAIGVGGFALGVVLWAMLTIVEFGAWILVVPPRARRRNGPEGNKELTEPPDHHEVSAREIEATAADTVRLAGRWYPASGQDGPARTVLLLHGFAEDPSVWERARAAILNAHGWNVAAVDSRGYGASGGLHASFGGHEASDISAWLDAIAGHVATPPAAGAFEAALWGRSMGAAIAMRAAERDGRIAALVLESPMVDLDRSVARLLRKRGLRATGFLARLITSRAGRIAGAALRRPRPLEVAARLKCSTLILHGTDDWLVPADEVRLLAEAFPQPPERIEIPGAGHSNVVATGGDELIARVAGFLDGAVQAIRVK
ncbi:MAG: alpha/beta hydrolase [Isosphaeraceae bacterium]